MHSSLFQQFIHTLAAEPISKTAFSALTETVIYEKSEVILPRGKVAKHLFFIDEGSVMGTRQLNDRFVTHRFWVTGELIIPMTSFFSLEPLDYSCTAIAQTTVKSIAHSGLMELVSNYSGGYGLITELLHRDHAYWLDRMCDLRDLSPVTRYKKFLVSYPAISQLVKSEFIASYLNISLATLARVKRSV